MNPFDTLGSAAAKIVVDAWIAAWMSVWNAGLWVLRLVLTWMDVWLTPDLSENGPGHDLYQVTWWISGSLALILMLVQTGIAAGRRDGKALGRVGIGLAQYGVVIAGWIGYCGAVMLAVGALTRGMLISLMGVTSWRAWEPWAPIDPKSIPDAATATILGLMGLLVWLAAIGHLLAILARNAAVLILVATGPISAAGLMNDSTRAWFWKTFRWFHAAVLSPLLMVIVTGVGMKFAEGVSAGKAGSIESSLGTALPAIILICVSVVSPLALFKLLAFVDPGTASGAAMRSGMQSMGGIQGLLGGSTSDSSAAQSNDGSQSAGEASADAATTARVSGAVQSGASMFGAAGAALAAGIGVMTKVGSSGASLLTDMTNQEGVGHNTYQPDYQGGDTGAARANRETNGQQSDAADPANDPAPPTPSSAPAGTPSTPAPPAGGVSAGSAGTGASGGAAAGEVSATEAAVLVL